ncbi:ShlB/FhaC/HecB family hemolysin secretion/activation protein [Massilia sp. MB5]|uniref:ShlB/FhaC/HecB family hemolysin secretion/activation protein n=1 Tax=Massilia sp. MB5 TaxID=2919578 RepID=UPI001F114488|nr:ShlB/FhaC/HecB family hemolysin secretion/activation protein [Massilia sp. MB5]UMR30296.1 ShlB/FhaC/HecB family hemolysin secretion/activation protein [Massilia sp. MB5]
MQYRLKLYSTAAMLCSVFVSVVHAQDAAGIAAQQLQRQQQRERAQAEQAEQRPDVRLQAPPAASSSNYPADESPCFPIRDIQLQGEQASQFAWALRAGEDALGRCLGSAGMNVLLARIQDALVAKGWVTTRVLAAPQDLRSGTLLLQLVPGRIRAVRFADPAARTAWRSAIPARPGDLLNLRDVEQALENFKRVPSAEADIEIVPGDAPGESDLLVKWRQAAPWRLSFSVDDSGSESTGKRQGGLSFALDNLLGWQDLLTVSANRHLPGSGPASEHGTRSTSLNYSLPYGYWLFSQQISDYRYHQTVAGANQDYIYSGTSFSAELKAARLVYRDAVRKTTLSLRVYQKRSRNFIDDTEVEVQRRRMGGFILGIAHKEFIGQATVDASLSYKKGSSAFGSLPAPEELFGDGTSRPSILNADLSVAIPFGKQVQLQSAWRAQRERTALIPQDRFAIGGRFTVRGFDGESSLMAERGWLSRNDLVWSLPGAQQLYLALDYGSVSGRSAPQLLGTRLGGGAIGWRGQFHGLQYDLFAGAPIAKPEHYRTAAVTGGFNLNYEF